MNRNLIRKIVSFGIVGGGASLIHIAVVWCLLKTVAPSIFIANTVGFLIALFWSYLGHYFVTFKSDRHHSSAFFQFALVALLGFFINNVVVLLWIYLFENQSIFAVILAVAVAAIAVFVASNFWAFKSAR